MIGHGFLLEALEEQPVENIVEVVAASAVIITVGMFLKYLSTQRTIWQKFIEDSKRDCHRFNEEQAIKTREVIAQNTQVIERINDTITYCKTKSEA